MNTVTFPNDILIPEIAKLVKAGHCVTMNVKGFSMRPFIEAERDEVLIEPLNQVRKGDVLLAKVTDGRFVLHRIIGFKEDVIVLQGDGNVSGTETCDFSNVIGRCKAIIRKSDSKQRLCEGHLWYFESSLWYLLRPVRRYLLALYRLWNFGHLHNSRIHYEN